MVTLSVIIPSYNTREMTRECIVHLLKNLSHYSFKSEIIVVDDSSTDGSYAMLESLPKHLSFPSHISFTALKTEDNKGYGAANNVGFTHARGKYTLLLNSDAFLEEVDLSELIDYMDSHVTVGALTVPIYLENGALDWACHRGFPTPWRALTYFSKLEQLSVTLPFLRRVFGGYHLLYKPLQKLHDIDTGMGAFYLIKTDVLRVLNGFDEDYFMYGEDIDLSYRLKQLGYRIMYYPNMRVLHKKRVSGLKSKSHETQKKVRYHFYHSMELFYDKYYQHLYPALITGMVKAVLHYKKQYG